MNGFSTDSSFFFQNDILVRFREKLTEFLKSQKQIKSKIFLHKRYKKKVKLKPDLEKVRKKFRINLSMKRLELTSSA